MSDSIPTTSSEPLTHRTNIFSKNWTITIPSHPEVKYIRITPSRFNDQLSIITNVANNEHQDTRDKIWDDGAIKETLERINTRYEEAPTKQQSVESFVELDGKVVGYGGIWGNSFPFYIIF
jgi:predicted oxidoreductase (fatty acid repression mutant protein)